ncbi:MAG: hypothetical protein RQ760_06050, partial [Sedimentisphaerales bacterium]|nr:hypothetical protein [Sedimentisphaerales bacterium]
MQAISKNFAKKCARNLINFTNPRWRYKNMNDLIKYHDNDQVIEQSVVSFESPPESYGENTSNLLKGILRRWPIVFLVSILICAVGIPAIWFLVEPLYTVTGAIRVVPIIENIVTGENESGGISNYQSYMNTQAEIITSSPVVQGVADDLADKNLSFFTDGPGDPISKIKQKLGYKRTKSDPAVILKSAITGGVITVVPPNRSELMRITMTSQNPDEASRIVDAFIRVYMRVEGDKTKDKHTDDLDFLYIEQKNWRTKMDDYKGQISKKEQEFPTVPNIDQKEVIQQSQRIPFLYAELTRLESRKINLETQKKLLDDHPEHSIEREEMIKIRNDYINSDPAVMELTRTIIQLERDLIMAQQNLSVENPVLQQKQELIDAFQLRLKDKRKEAEDKFDVMAAKEAVNASIIKLRAVEAELELISAHEETLRDKLEKEDLEMLNVGLNKLDIKDLQYEFEQAKEMYDKFSRRIQELEMTLDLERKRPARITRAYSADIGPIIDKRVKYIMALIFGALGCG